METFKGRGLARELGSLAGLNNSQESNSDINKAVARHSKVKVKFLGGKVLFGKDSTCKAKTKPGKFLVSRPTPRLRSNFAGWCDNI